MLVYNKRGLRFRHGSCWRE